MSGLFGLDGDTPVSPTTPKYTTRAKALMPMTASWHAIYRHNPSDPEEIALIPVIGIATVEVMDLTNPAAPLTSTVFRPFVMLPSGTITDAASLTGFVCLISDEQSPEVSEDTIQETISAFDSSDSGT